MIKFFKYIVIAGLLALFTGCQDSYVEPVPEFLDVTPSNIEGVWQLTAWRGEALPEGRYFYIVLERTDCLFTTYENTASFGPHKETGYYNLIEDEYTGEVVIRGLYDYTMGEEWNHQYVVSSLTGINMDWTVVGDTDDISSFTRIDSLPDFLAE